MKGANPIQILFGENGWKVFALLSLFVPAVIQVYEVPFCELDTFSALLTAMKFGFGIVAGAFFVCVVGITVEILLQQNFSLGRLTSDQLFSVLSLPSPAVQGLRRPPRLFA